MTANNKKQAVAKPDLSSFINGELIDSAEKVKNFRKTMKIENCKRTKSEIKGKVLDNEMGQFGLVEEIRKFFLLFSKA